jgi:RNA polymerase sigma-70 factor, ECF subfamily
LKNREQDFNEQDLVTSAQKDPERFAELYQLHFERVYAFLAARVHNRSAVQDLTSEVFHHALANLRRYEWRGTPFAAWLYRIASNTLADYFQRESKERALSNPENSGEVHPELSEHRAALFQAVSALSSDQRRVILMRFAKEKSIREIATAMARSEGAVKQLQLRALRNLRARMGEKNG